MLFYEDVNESHSPPSYAEALNFPSLVQPSTPGQERKEELKPKLCKMEKTSAGYGFHLNGIQGMCGQYIKEVRITSNACHSIVIISNQNCKTQLVSGGEGWSSRQGGSGR